PLPALNSGFIPNAAQRPSVKGLAKINPWMYVDAKRQHVVIMMVAAAKPTKNGFNFDCYDNGKENFIVPQGWTVDWIFSNASALPHSAGLVTQPKSGAQPIVLGLAPIETANALQGINAKQEQYISFNTVTTGKFYLACLVPGHIQSGMWDVFTISPTAKMPSIVAK
ncbi:MAG: hypothetical protein JWO42_3578, partial [Chloroflexi bacterium]|nr:hypothetical protein [Chloroflexota bacterium]